MADETPTPAGTGAAAPPPEVDTSEGGTVTGWAVYDHTLLRYVTGVHPTKAKAQGELVKEDGHKYEARQV